MGEKTGYNKENDPMKHGTPFPADATRTTGGTPMAYTLRVLVRCDRLPPLTHLYQELVDEGFRFGVWPGPDDAEAASTDWTEAILYHAPDRDPFTLTRLAPGDEDMAQEMAALRSSLETLPTLEERRQAHTVLAQTQQLVRVELPDDLTEEDEGAWTLLDAVLHFFVRHGNGYVHAEQDGLYDRDGRLVFALSNPVD